MTIKTSRIPTPVQRKNGPLTIEKMNEMVALYNANQWEALVTMAQDVTRIYPEHVFGWKALGKALLRSGKPSDSVAPLSRAIKIAPNDADTCVDLATAHQSLGQLNDAETNYRRAIKLAPGSAPMHDTLGALLCELGRFEDAEVEFRRALELNPLLVQAHINLGYVAGTLIRFEEAEACYLRALELSPDFSEIHRRLGDLLSRIPSRSVEAIGYLERAIALNPADVGSVVTLGNVLMVAGRKEESQAMFRRALQIQPLITWPAKKPRPDFSVLLLDAPGAGSTPVNYLVGRAGYESHFAAVMADVTHDLKLLLSKADVVINMIADADNGKEVLPLALDLADRLNRPIVNHPRKIMNTDRQSIAHRLGGIPLCRVPKTVRFTAAEMASADWQQALAEFSLPLLIRCAGTHGGDDFEKVSDLDAVAAFVSRHPDATFYVSEFIDYRSADGYYRKYRVICIDGDILPYHLAIHNDWMVHHFRTDMANQEWMRKEEEAFLQHMEQVFGSEHQAALRQAGMATGLDYCGIDCSLDSNGNIVIFEANATMLVHDEKNTTFAYKNPYIAKIKEAFDRMLSKMAGHVTN